MNIAQEIYESVQELYQEIIKVDLETGNAVVLHSSSRPERRGEKVEWDSYLSGYIRERIQPEDHERLLKSFDLGSLRIGSEKGKNLFSSNFSTLEKDSPSSHITMLGFAPENGRLKKVYVLLRNAGQEYLMWSIVNQYVSATCDYFIYLDAKNNSYKMFSRKEGTPLPPEVCNDYEQSKIDYANQYIVEEDREMAIREMRLSRVLEVLKTKDIHAFSCGIMEPDGYARKRLEYRYYDRERKMILLSRTDVTNAYLEEQRKSQRLEELLYKAQTDPLTKICNFQATFDQISEKLANTDDSYAFYFVDLDNFKQVNDTMGHPVGDDVLRQVADGLKKTVGPENIAGRVGGDEFVAFVKLKERTSEEIAEVILSRIREVTLEEWPDAEISGSVGIAIAPKDGRDYYALLKHADSCLYQAKSNGKDRWCMDHRNHS